MKSRRFTVLLAASSLYLEDLQAVHPAARELLPERHLLEGILDFDCVENLVFL